MLWPELEDRRLKDPDRQLLDAIAAGELDEHLVAIADAVGARQELLHTTKRQRVVRRRLGFGPAAGEVPAQEAAAGHERRRCRLYIRQISSLTSC